MFDYFFHGLWFVTYYLIWCFTCFDICIWKTVNRRFAFPSPDLYYLYNWIGLIFYLASILKVRAVIQEFLQSHEITKAIATKEIVWYMVRELPIVLFIYFFLSSVMELLLWTDIIDIFFLMVTFFIFVMILIQASALMTLPVIIIFNYTSTIFRLVYLTILC